MILIGINRYHDSLLQNQFSSSKQINLSSTSHKPSYNTSSLLMLSFKRSRFVELCFVVFIFFSFYFLVTFAEKKVSVTEVVFDSSIEDIQWLGSNYRTVICRSSGGRLYRSLDSGRNWSEITDLLKIVAEADTREEIFVRNIIVNPTDKDVVIVVGKKDFHFRSVDSARTFSLLDHLESIHNFLFHPTKPHWALMSRWTDACTSTSLTATNLGETFNLVSNYVVQYSWGDPKTRKEDAIFFTHFTRGKSFPQPRVGGWSDYVHFGMVPKPGASPKRLVSQGNKFLVSNGYIFVAKLLDSERQTVTLMVSTDGGSSFKAAKLPVELQERSYTILDTSENSVMLHVNHGHSAYSSINVGNVYISDAAGLRYSLSLPKNVRTTSGECEFDRVASLEGVYIANFQADPPRRSLDIEDSSTTTSNGDEEDEDEELDALETGIEKRHRKSMKGKEESLVKTVISFDKGGIWSYLKPPRIDSRGKKIDCQKEFERLSRSNATAETGYTDLSGGSEQRNQCWLHLHGITNFHRYAPFYSIGNAVGLIMGTGNVGSSLRYEEDQVNTYLSRDGGLNWVEAHKGAYIYEFGDHGGLIVMADDVKKTNQVVFSWNEGQSWYDFDLGEQQLNVDNIVIEPNSSSVEFLMYGTRGGAGVLYHLDFATLGQPSCKGVWAADSVSSDYETWMPTDGRTGDNCILGRQLTFTRRKQTSECFNGLDFSRPIEKKNCTCTERDYECEFGFTRKIGSTTCIPEDPALTQEGCQSSGIFFTDAYRRIPGDACIGGWIPNKVPVLCPETSPFSTRARLVLLLLFGILGGLGLMTWFNDNPRFKSLFGNIGLDSISSAKYAVIGGAARFLDAFDRNHGHDDVQTIDKHFTHEFDPTGDLEFIEAELHDGDDIDAPPLLDFSSSPRSVSDLSFNQSLPMEVSASRRGGLRTATESVPRLAPPNPNTHPVREFEML